MFGKIKDKLKSLFSKNDEIIEDTKEEVIETKVEPEKKVKEIVEKPIKEIKKDPELQSFRATDTVTPQTSFGGLRETKSSQTIKKKEQEKSKKQEKQTEEIEDKNEKIDKLKIDKIKPLIVEDVKEISKKTKILEKKPEKKIYEQFSYEEPFVITGLVENALDSDLEDYFLYVYKNLNKDSWGGLCASTKPITRKEIERLSTSYNQDPDNEGVPYYFIIQDKNENLGIVFSNDNFIYTLEQAKEKGTELGLKKEHLIFKEKEIKANIKEEVKIKEEQKKSGFFSKIFGKKEEIKEQEELSDTKELEEEMLKELPKDEIVAIKQKKEIKTEEIIKNKKELEKQIIEEEIKEKEKLKETEEKKGFFAKTFEKLKSKKIDQDDFDKIWGELQLFLLEINIAYEIVEKIETNLKTELIGNSFDRFALTKKIREVLEKEVEKVLKKRESSFLDELNKIKNSGEIIKILILGVNGTGKTTTIAKIVHFLQKHDFKVVVAAADTFRAAAVEQLGEHSKKLNFKLIQHKGGSDPAAVAFDAIEHAKAKKLDIVLIDTAGRMPNNTNLMSELQKIKRISNAQMTIFIGDSISGNDLIEQIELFNKAIKIDGIILTKVDTDEKPGSIVTTAYSIEKPIYFLGTGQTYDDLIEFDSKLIAKKLFETDDE